MNQGVVEPTGHRIHISGQVAWDARLNVLHHGDAGAQTSAALGNIEKVLSAVGGTLDDVVSLTTYYIREEDKAAITAARAKVFKKEFGPASTGIQVMKIWNNDLLVELVATAVVPENRFYQPDE